MMKIACSFDAYIEEEKDYYGEYKVTVEDKSIVTSDWLVPPDCIEFDPDILESVLQTDEFKKCQPKKWYHIFAYGELNAEYSYSLEGGKEFDGWIFEEEFILISELPLITQEEQ